MKTNDQLISAVQTGSPQVCISFCDSHRSGIGPTLLISYRVLPFEDPRLADMMGWQNTIKQHIPRGTSSGLSRASSWLSSFERRCDIICWVGIKRRIQVKYEEIYIVGEFTDHMWYVWLASNGGYRSNMLRHTFLKSSWIILSCIKCRNLCNMFHFMNQQHLIDIVMRRCTYPDQSDSAVIMHTNVPPRLTVTANIQCYSFGWHRTEHTGQLCRNIFLDHTFMY